MTPALESWPPRLPPGLPPLIAHRGGGTLAPENTLAGLRTAVRYGYRGVEFDVMLSGDGTPLLIHDETLERTTNGRGHVVDTPDAALFALDAGSWFAPAFVDERIPRFSEAAALCRQLGLWANVEIKPAAGHEEATGEAVARQTEALWQGGEPPLLSSFSTVALEAAWRTAPALPRGLLVRAIPADWRAQVEALGCASLHCNAARNELARIREVLAAGVAVVCYTVNDQVRARELLRAGAAVITDRLDLLAPDAA